MRPVCLSVCRPAASGGDDRLFTVCDGFSISGNSFIWVQGIHAAGAPGHNSTFRKMFLSFDCFVESLLLSGLRCCRDCFG